MMIGELAGAEWADVGLGWSGWRTWSSGSGRRNSRVSGGMERSCNVLEGLAAIVLWLLVAFVGGNLHTLIA